MKSFGSYASPWSFAAPALALALLCTSAVGCRAHHSDGDRWAKELSNEISSLRASNRALQERISALEEADQPLPEASPPLAASDRPPLKVVRLGPPQRTAAPPPMPAVASETGPRPIIRANRYGARIDHLPPTTQAGAPSASPRR